ncbi:DNA primase [Candidatus Velamenicoccus archaeovorus]|uniref:DNA primase n=1 Tax=Velamenicoccus archaeovorus TaxID=1930593 RepID=A0A410P416_VELA1|nr:DNA primase [Candidatus Velamenicoccus archaeovorus]QAT16947.1 DNA primase [Candidatus Velamenicoccus archaeovorus]
MPRLYPDNLISDVLDRCNIVELISSYIPLKRAGRNFRANCPFHAEKTPSFIVSTDKQIFHCFGCGQGGNAITFVMQYEKVGFREALETVAQRCGIPLPEPELTPSQKGREDNRKTLQGLYEQAASFYHARLFQASDAKNARNYLAGRGISKETAQRFRLGHAPEGWDSLIAHFKSQKVSLAALDKSGLIVAKENGGYYDRYRNRIMFPIADIKGRVIAFGGRVLDDSLPKYINSPETAVYIKGKNLFGLDVSKEYIRQADQVVVVEGYLDMIVPFEAGVKNIVASLGTALTEDQIRLIKRFTNRVVLLYDPDAAGEMATLRALELLIKEDMDIRIASLPKGKDPDAFVRHNGGGALKEIIDKALPIFDYKLNLLLAKYDAKSTHGKDKIVREILPTIRHFKHHTTRAEYVKRAAASVGVDEEALLQDLKNMTETARPAAAPDNDALAFSALEHQRLTEIPVTERMLVKLMLEEMHLIDHLRQLIEPSDFVSDELRKIVTFIFDFFDQGKNLKPNVLMHYLDDDEAINIIAELAALDIHNCPEKEKLIEDCVRRLKRDKILHRCQELHNRIREAQTSGDEGKLHHLVLEYNNLIKKRSAETAGYGTAAKSDRHP